MEIFAIAFFGLSIIYSIPGIFRRDYEMLQSAMMALAVGWIISNGIEIEALRDSFNQLTNTPPAGADQ